MWKALAAIVVLVVLVGSFKDYRTTETQKETAERAALMAAQAAAAAASQAERQREACQAQKQALLDQFQQALAKKQLSQAAQVLEPCADRLQDPALKKLRDGAIAADLVETATREQMQTRIRVQALERLQRDYPSEFAGREALLARLEKRRLAEVAAEKRKEGVTPGMTQEEVLASSWGKPRKINRSTYTFGTREQWVYDGGYLYFRDGILDSIQN
jgi:hypothetical protein